MAQEAHQEGTAMTANTRYVAGDRVWVEYEGSAGTVLIDNGRDKFGDYGVLVKLDSDGETVSCAHDQLTRERDPFNDADWIKEGGK
jgi:hypothetical protein